MIGGVIVAVVRGRARAPVGVPERQVVDYLVYLATDAAGASKTLAASVVPSGTNTAWVPAETPLAAFSHLVVFARSALFEQTTPGAVALVERTRARAPLHA